MKHGSPVNDLQAIPDSIVAQAAEKLAEAIDADVLEILTLQTISDILHK